MKERYLGVKILNWTYLLLVALVYIFVSKYINSDINTSDGELKSLILVFITSFIGTYSKQYYESMVYMIYNFETDVIPEEVNRMVLKSFAITNWLTVMLLSSFFVKTLNNNLNVIALFGVILISSLLFLIAIIFKFSDNS